MKHYVRKYFMNIWNNSEHILISLFFLTFTFNIRKVFLTPFSYLNGSFNEYNTFSFSWADLLMLSTIIIYTIKYILSQYKHPSLDLHKTSRENVIIKNNKGYLSSVLRRITHISCETYLLFFFIAWCFISLSWSTYKPIAIYRSLTLLEILVFFYITYKLLKNNPAYLRYYIYFILFNGTFQSLLGITQFILGHSIGLSIIGESFVSHETPGVAKIIIDGAKHIRAYGTFAHPNILAGFLLIPIFIIIGKLFSNPLSIKNYNSLLSTSVDHQPSNNKLIFPRETILYNKSKYFLFFLLSINLIGLGLTFSRSAILGLFLGLTIFMFHVKHIKRIKWIILSIVLIALMLSFLSINFINKHSSLLSIQSIEERVLYNNISHETINEQPMQGTGIGQFVITEFRLLPNLNGWQYQPEHNSYLLIFSELGAVGFTLFSLFLILLATDIKKKTTLTFISFYCLIISFGLILFFDHYFWDIRVGIVIFALGITLMKIEPFYTSNKHIFPIEL